MPETTLAAEAATHTKPKRRFRLASKGAVKRLGVLVLIILGGWGILYRTCVWMPGASFKAALPVATAEQAALAEELRGYVEGLAGGGGVGKRSTMDPRGMAAAGRHLMAKMSEMGYPAAREVFVERGARVPNLEYTIKGTTKASEIVVVGAHYDTFQGTPGADDNASGCAAVLALAKRLKDHPQARTIRLVFFVNEEPPAFWTEDMGSWVYAKECRKNNDNITAMLSLEAIGFYTDEIGYQKYPPLVGAGFPEEGNFIGFIGNIESRGLTRRCIGTFRETTKFPSEGAALPQYMAGVGWSDHWSFWKEGYVAVMVTDTAIFRNPHYHLGSDKPETLNYDSMARVVEGMERVVRELAGE